jgi:hypothetical protein
LRSLIIGISSSVLTAGLVLAALSLTGRLALHPGATRSVNGDGPTNGSMASTDGANRASRDSATSLNDAGSPGLTLDGDSTMAIGASRRLSLVVTDRPLREVLAEVQRRTGVRIVISDLVPDAPTSAQFDDDPVEQALKRLLTPFDSYFLYGARPGRAGGADIGAGLSAVLVYPQGHGRFAEPGSDLLAAMLDSGLIANPDELAGASRERSSTTMATQSGQPSAETLRAALADADESVRIEALQSLLQQAPTALPDQALQNLARHDASATLRSMALAGLVDRAEAGLVEPAEIQTALMLARADPDPVVAELAIRLSANVTAIAGPDETEPQGAEPDPQLQGAGAPPAAQ